MERYHDPAALTHLTMALSDILYKYLQTSALPGHMLRVVPPLYACVHRKVGQQWRRMLWQVRWVVVVVGGLCCGKCAFGGRSHTGQAPNRHSGTRSHTGPRQ